MHYKAMGDLGYTGSLNDRIHKYLTEKYGSFYEAMRDLRNGTSIFSLISAYAVNNFDPSLVFDFEQNYYRTGGTETTLNPAVTHTRAGQATMTDSDGKIKWAPHNLVTYSEDFSDASWSKFAINATANSITEDTSTSFHGLRNALLTATINTFEVEAKEDSGRYLIVTLGQGNTSLLGGGVVVDLQTGTILTASGAKLLDSSISPVGDGYHRIKIRVDNTGASNTPAAFIFMTKDPTHVLGTTHGSDSYTGDGVSTILLRKAATYRSDLGGMVNNPETGDSYVPTTSSAVYLPRVGHHIYNGSAWVNEGVLHESEARTNLLTYSEDFSNGAWTKQSGTTVTANQAIAPDGTTTADLVVGNGSSGLFAFKAGTNGVVTTLTRTVWIRSVIGTPTVTLKDPVFTAGIVSCNLTTKWQSFVLTEATTGTNGNMGGLWVANIPTSGIYVWGAQMEVGSTPSSYIPTSGSTVTRAAETLTVPAANLPYDSTNMSIQMDGRMTYADTGSVGEAVPFRWVKDGNNFILNYMRTDSTRSGSSYFQQKALNVSVSVESVINLYSPDINVPFNIASRHGSTFINGAVEGTALTANTTPTALPDLSTTDLNLGYTFMGTIGKFRVWSDDLTDTGIATASAPTFTTEFAMTIATTGANETFTIPCQNVGTFNAGIEWGDGSVSTVTSYNDASLTHTYATAGDHLIRIRGSFPNIYFNNTGDKLKVKSVENLGVVGWTTLVKGFRGCTNLTSFTVGTTDTSSVTNTSNMLRSLTSLTSLDLSSFDTSSVTNFESMFRECTNLTSLDVSSFDTSSVTNFGYMFNGSSSLTTLDVSSFDTSSATGWGSMRNMFNSSSLTSLVGAEDFDITSFNNTNSLTGFMNSNGRMTTAQYDALLVKWDAQSVLSNIVVEFGASQYTAGSAAATARANLISSDGWTIADGGTA